VAERQTNFILKAKDAASGPIGKVGRALHDLEQKAKSLGGKTLGGVASGIASVAKAAAAAAVGGVLALAAGFTAAIVKAAAFEKAMLNVNTIAKATPAEFEHMRQAVLDLSRDLPQSAEELATGLYNIASSGFAGAEGLKVLEAAAKAASAGLSTTDEAAKGITAVLNAYGLGADRAEYVSDVLFKTVERGVVTFSELARQIGDVTAIAPLVGVSLEEVGAAMAVLTVNGINAAEAATSLSSFMRSILSPSQEALDVAEDLGIEWNIAALQAKGLAGFLGDLTAAAGDNEEALATLAGDARAIKAVFLLARDGGAEFNAELALMLDAAGATDDALSIQKKGLSYQFQILKNNISAVAITIGTELIPKITPLVMELTEFVQALFATDEPLTVLGGHMADTGEQSDTLQDKLAEWGPLGQIVSDAIGYINRTWQDLQDLWITAGPVIADVVTAFIGPGGILESVREVAGQIADWLIPKLTALWTTLVNDVAPSVLAVVTPIAQKLLPAFGRLVNALFGGEGHRGLIPAVGDLAGKLWGGGSGPLAIAVKAIGLALEVLFGTLIVIADAIAAVVDAINAASSAAAAFFSTTKSKTYTPPAPTPTYTPPTTYTAPTYQPSGGGRYTFQHGGFTSGTHPILVGEKGPEVFVPGGPGTVIPNGGGGLTVNFNSIWPPTLQQAREIAKVVDRVLYYQRPGLSRVPR